MEFIKIEGFDFLVVNKSKVDEKDLLDMVKKKTLAVIEYENDLHIIEDQYIKYEDYEKIMENMTTDLEEDLLYYEEEEEEEDDTDFDNESFIVLETSNESILFLKGRIDNHILDKENEKSNSINELMCANTFAHLINIEKDITKMYESRKMNDRIRVLCELTKGDFNKYYKSIKNLIRNHRISEDRDNPDSIYRFFDEVNGEYKFVDGLVGEEILAENHFFYELGVVYIYKNGKYHPKAERDIDYLITTKLGVNYFTKSRRENIFSYLLSKIRVELDIGVVLNDEKQKKLNSQFINMKNGLLNIKTGKLVKHTPEILSKNQLAVDYNPKASKVFANTFLKQVLERDTKPFIEEFIGYSLTIDMSEQVALMLTGSGSNGKSVFIQFMNNMIGSDNTTSVTLKDFDGDKFKIVQLKDKLLNVGADISAKRLDETESFKKVISGDSMMGEFKGVDSFNFQPYAKNIFSANELPSTIDASDGFFRRWKIVPFNQNFTGREDKDIFTKITNTDNLEGLFLIAFEGLQRLRNNGSFTPSKTSDELRNNYIDANKPVKRFINEEFIVYEDDDKIETDFISLEDIFELYQDWCERSGMRSKNRDNMMKDVYRDFPFLRERSKKRTVDGKRKAVLMGVIPQIEEVSSSNIIDIFKTS